MKALWKTVAVAVIIGIAVSGCGKEEAAAEAAKPKRTIDDWPCRSSNLGYELDRPTIKITKDQMAFAALAKATIAGGWSNGYNPANLRGKRRGYGMRTSSLPQHERMLVAQNGDFHDPG